jgi:ribonuclease VapC
MFVDASAIVAILEGEPGAEALAEALERARSPITSPIAVFEAVLAVRRRRHATVAKAEEAVADFLAVAGIRLVALTGEEAAAALSAFARYGKGQGHPAQLNLGDCFAYAVARTHATSLLFAGGDFARTDIPSAGPATT